MEVYLIRHAQAGQRGDGFDDHYRPLSAKGRRRARELAWMLAPVGITRVLSSPATRCTQTVAPLALALGLEVEERDELCEGADVGDVLALLGADHAGPVAACSHGDVIPEVIEALAAAGTPIRGDRCEKGSVWVLVRDGARWVDAHYVPKAATALPGPGTVGASSPAARPGGR
jgi:8-oxo-dGTP diphosphatase